MYNVRLEGMLYDHVLAPFCKLEILSSRYEGIAVDFGTETRCQMIFFVNDNDLCP